MDLMASSSSQLDTSVDSTTSDFGIDGNQQRNTLPETVIAKFLLQVIGVATSKLHQLIFSQGNETSQDMTFLQQELSHLLLFVIYMFQSGRYYKVHMQPSIYKLFMPVYVIGFYMIFLFYIQ
jgi:hypothetical protein